jgi:hypothetical protein
LLHFDDIASLKTPEERRAWLDDWWLPLVLMLAPHIYPLAERIADCTVKTGRAFATDDWYAGRLGCPLRTIKHQMKRLDELCLIDRLQMPWQKVAQPKGGYPFRRKRQIRPVLGPSRARDKGQ